MAAAHPSFRSGNEIVFSTVVFGLGWALGQAVREWRRRHEILGHDLLTLAESTALREQAAAAAERARIARELHDVVAHGVSVMVVQAGAAAALLDPRRGGRRAAVAAVRAPPGREALAEMRRLLGRAARRTTSSRRTRPQPGLRRAARAGRGMRAGSGCRVDRPRRGRPADAAAPGVDLAAYRIVQEALTNVLKHAGPRRRARSRRATAGRRCELEVADDGARPAPTAARGGHGLVGMRERAALYGGTLEAGPGRGGGFRVHAPVCRSADGRRRDDPGRCSPTTRRWSAPGSG